MNDELLTSDEVAALLKVKVPTVRDAAWRGKIPCVRLWSGRKKTLLRFLRSDIEAFIRERSTAPRTKPSTERSID